MAPMIEDSILPPTGSSNAKASDSKPIIYANVDEKALNEDAENCLANYGTKFEKDIIVGSRSLYVYTASGHKCLDSTSGQMSCLIGHGHRGLVSTIHNHAAQLDHLFSGMLSPLVINLAKRLTPLLPPGLDTAFFLSTGGESNETAIKMAKVYTGKFEIVGLGASWHDVTAQALGTQYHFGRKGQGPLMPGMHMLPPPNSHLSIFRRPDGGYGWETELDYGWDLIDRAFCGSLAACIVECIQSSAGMHVLPPGYLKALRSTAKRETGVGRCGDLFAINHEDVVPDVLTLSKTPGNGLPLSAVVMSSEIERVCKERDFCFYTTHVNDPLPAAVGDKVLKIVVRDNLVAHSREMSQQLHAGLQKLKSRYAYIGDVRGRGLMAGVEIVGDREAKTRAIELARRIASKMYELGLWANLSSHSSFSGVFRIAPPIVITKEQLDQGLGMEEAFHSTEGTIPLY